MTLRYDRGVIFKPAAREPVDPRAVFILAASAISGCLAIALGAAPDSLGAILPQWGVMLWSILVTLGSIVTMVGMATKGVNGIVTEQVGSAVIAGSTLFYSYVAFSHVGSNALQSVGIVTAWGLACGLRWFQLWLLLHKAQSEKDKRDLLQAICDAPPRGQ